MPECQVEQLSLGLASGHSWADCDFKEHPECMWATIFCHRCHRYCHQRYPDDGCQVGEAKRVDKLWWARLRELRRRQPGVIILIYHMYENGGDGDNDDYEVVCSGDDEYEVVLLSKVHNGGWGCSGRLEEVARTQCGRFDLTFMFAFHVVGGPAKALCLQNILRGG